MLFVKSLKLSQNLEIILSAKFIFLLFVKENL